MSDENSTHFQFRLGGIELEISGERTFVEKMYQRVMRDIEQARRQVVPPPADESSSAEVESRIVWVHRCSSMMHKIYMSSPTELSRASLLRCIDPSSVKILYAEKDVFEHILPNGGRGQTLWAELTERGRRRIAAAAPER